MTALCLPRARRPVRPPLPPGRTPSRTHRRLEPPAIIALIKPRFERLEKALGDILAEQRAAEATLIAKRAAMERHERMLSTVVSDFRALFRGRGMDEVAARLRPWAQLRELRRARPVEVAPAVAEDTSSVDTAPPSATAPSAQTVSAVGREPPVDREPPRIEAPTEHAPSPVRGGRRRFYRTLRSLARRVMLRAPPGRAKPPPTRLAFRARIS